MMTEHRSRAFDRLWNGKEPGCVQSDVAAPKECEKTMRAIVCNKHRAFVRAFARCWIQSNAAATAVVQKKMRAILDNEDRIYAGTFA